MRISIDESFELATPPDAVWGVLQDPYQVVPCVPGAEITEKLGDDKYKGKVTMKLGPVSVRFGGDIVIAHLDHEARTLVLEGAGRDAKGKGNASMRLEGAVTEKDGGGTVVATTMTLSIRGRLAQFGARLIKDVSAKVFDQFVTCFRERLENTDAGLSSEAGPANAGTGPFRRLKS